MNHPTPSFVLTALGGTVAAIALAPAAHAATVATDRACYIEQQPMGISGTGFAPGARFSVETEQLFGFGNADAAGNFLLGTETAPIVPTVTPDAKTFTLVAKQDQTPVASTTFQVANFAFSVKPARARPTSKVRYRFSGFEQGRNVYVHVRRKGRTVGTARMGKALGPCGRLSVRKRFMPVRGGRVPYGSYTYQFDMSRRYSSKTRPALRGSVSIFRTLR